MNNKLSKETITIIRNSAELITKNDIEISIRMYELLFLKHPELKKFFEGLYPKQYMRLAETLSAYAVNIHMIDRLKPALQAIAEQHINANIKAVQYPMVGMALIEAMEDVLGDRATLEFIDAWREAYRYIANILIEMEQELYKSQELINS